MPAVPGADAAGFPRRLLGVQEQDGGECLQTQSVCPPIRSCSSPPEYAHLNLTMS